MYVCVCHAITDRQIREAIDQGAESLMQLQQVLPVASCCGRCEGTARELIDSELQNRNCAQAA